MDSLLDLCAVVTPFALVILAALMSIKLSQAKSPTLIWLLIILIGIVGSALTYVQQSRSKAEQLKSEAELNSQLHQSRLDQEFIKGKLSAIGEIMGKMSQSNSTSYIKQMALAIEQLAQLKPTKKAMFGFTFWPPRSDGTFINKIALPIENGIITVDLAVKNISTVQATNGGVWIRVHDGCRFEEDPQGLKTLQTLGNFVVKGTRYAAIYAGTYLSPIELKIIPPPRIDSFTIDFAYACEKCPPADENNETQKLVVFIKR